MTGALFRSISGSRFQNSRAGNTRRVTIWTMTDLSRDLPNEQTPANPLSAGCSRVFAYIILVPTATVATFELGSSRVEEHCSECDMAGVEGLAWATVTLVVLLVAIVVGELLLARRRRQQSGGPSHTDTPPRVP